MASGTWVSNAGVTRRLRARPCSRQVVHVKDRAFNDRRYYIGSSKLAALGWTERTGWEEGLRKTVDWCGSPGPPLPRPHPVTRHPTRVPHPATTHATRCVPGVRSAVHAWMAHA
jgi:hypothetical protein